MRNFLLSFCLLMVTVADAQNPNLPFRQSLNARWEFRQAHTGEWLPATVPGTVHHGLLKAGKIPDPFWRDNEDKVQWIEKEDWEFQGAFDIDPVLLQRKHLELILRGLDTYAQVYLNDSLILESDNMFRTYQVDIKRFAKPGPNTLHVYLVSPIRQAEKPWKDLGYELPGGIRTMTRKAQFHYGWDWGARLVTSGILKAPELLAWNDFLLEDVFVIPQQISPERAKMVARFRYRSDVQADVTVFAREGKHKSVEDRKIFPGVREDSVTFEVPNPKLWWCHGLGEPFLYDFSIEVRRNTTSIEKAEVRAGIRTIELVTMPDAKGESFYFKLNGKPVFCKGANYIPQDMFQDRVQPAQYKQLLDDAVAANMNMLRVWGGGIYEDDLFYQLCDARGILVWQDFMFACAMYPGSGSFFKNAAREAFEQIYRLRQHPCLALWCGNNENDEAWHNWGWQMGFNESQRAQIWRDYKTLFKDILATYVGNEAGGVPYWESSPKFGRANPKSNTTGDAHYWGVWHDEKPFDAYDKNVPRFMSEYGFQSFPDQRTIESFTEPEDRKLDSKVMLARQKFPRGNALISEYMQRDYQLPKNFEDFVYVSQLLQAEAMQRGMEAHRRNKPYCMGTLYWQLNDVWPAISWAGRDYFGRWKALHYAARASYSPLAALPFLVNDQLKIMGVSDLSADTSMTLQVTAFSLDGKILGGERFPGMLIDSDTAHILWETSIKNLIRKEKPENAVVEIQLLHPSDNALAYRRLFFFVAPKRLQLSDPQIVLKVESTAGGYNVTVSTEKLAKNVFLKTRLDGFFSDNFFDMLPGETRQVFFKTEAQVDNPAEAFRIQTLNQLKS